MPRKIKFCILYSVHKKQSLHSMSSRLFKLTCLMRFLKVSNESESRLNFSSFDHRTGPSYDKLCLLYATVLESWYYEV